MASLAIRNSVAINRRSLVALATSSTERCNHSRAKQPTDLKGRSASAQRWLVRQFKDPYVVQAKLANYRCRSAFKLIEIDDRHKILRPGFRVVDCGAAPGSWTQVAVERTNSLGRQKDAPVGRVVSVDKNDVMRIEGARILGLRDFTAAETHKEISACFASESSANDGLVDVVISDMAPSATGQPEVDHERIVELAYEALVFAARHLTKGGFFLTKIWSGKSEVQLKTDMEKLFEKVVPVKPEASRDDSAEVFLLGKHFKGAKSGVCR